MTNPLGVYRNQSNKIFNKAITLTRSLKACLFGVKMLDSDDIGIRTIARQVWNPIKKRKKANWIRELTENLVGIIIEGGSNIENIFKREVKYGLIRQSVQNSERDHSQLSRVNPRFRREGIKFLRWDFSMFPQVQIWVSRGLCNWSIRWGNWTQTKFQNNE